MELRYCANVWPEGDGFVAAARPLDVLSAGDSESEALQMLAEAVELFVKTATNEGNLERIPRRVRL